MIVDQAGNTTDWPETFLSLLDVNNIPETPGRDLTPLRDSANVAGWDDVSISRKYWIAAMDSRHKLVLDFQGKPLASRCDHITNGNQMTAEVSTLKKNTGKTAFSFTACFFAKS